MDGLIGVVVGVLLSGSVQLLIDWRASGRSTRQAKADAVGKFIQAYYVSRTADANVASMEEANVAFKAVGKPLPLEVAQEFVRGKLEATRTFNEMEAARNAVLLIDNDELLDAHMGTVAYARFADVDGPTLADHFRALIAYVK